MGQEKLLKISARQKTPTADELKQLILSLDNHRVLAKVFLPEGTPFVFATFGSQWTTGG